MSARTHGRAGDPPGDRVHGDTCQGDSGGPAHGPRRRRRTGLRGRHLLGCGCNDAAFPGVYARMGSEPLNAWTLHRNPRGELRPRSRGGRDAARAAVLHLHAPRWTDRLHLIQVGLRPGRPVRRPAGASLVETFPTPGQQVIGLEASNGRGDRATFYGAFNVAAAPVTRRHRREAVDAAAVRRRTDPAAPGGRPPRDAQVAQEPEGAQGPLQRQGELRRDDAPPARRP